MFTQMSSNSEEVQRICDNIPVITVGRLFATLPFKLKFVVTSTPVEAPMLMV